jgi:hypothetical protein
MSLLKPAVALGSTLWLLAANAGLEAPRLGFVRLADNHVRALRGVAGSFYFGEPMASEVRHFAFNGRIGVRTSANQSAELIGSSGEVLRTARIDGKVRAIGLSPLEASAYVLTDAELWRLNASAVERFPAPDVPAEGQLAGLSGSGSYIDLVLVQEGQVSMLRHWMLSGETQVRQAFSAQVQHLLVLKENLLLWTEGESLVLRRADASLAKIETGSRLVALQEAGDRWFHATGEDGRQFAIRLQGDAKLLPSEVDITLKLLPESAR